MNNSTRRLVVGLAILLAGLFFWLSGFTQQSAAVRAQQQGCLVLKDPSEVPGPSVINFDNLAPTTIIGAYYQAAYGVTFEDARATRGVILENSANAHSLKNVGYNEPVGGDSANIPMRIFFNPARTHVGFWLGGGNGDTTSALITAYNAAGQALCETVVSPVPAAHTKFVGLAPQTDTIATIEISYGSEKAGEAIDDLTLNSDRALPTPTRTPMKTWTPIPSPTPTKGPAPTATPVVPMFAYKPVLVDLPIFQFQQPDFAIHGIEITQGIQCFDTSKGLAGCANNSMPVVNKKDATARIYLKANNASSNYSNVPVRLHIFADGVEYIANASGKADYGHRPVEDRQRQYLLQRQFQFHTWRSLFTPRSTRITSTARPNETNNRYPPLGQPNISLTSASATR